MTAYQTKDKFYSNVRNSREYVKRQWDNLPREDFLKMYGVSLVTAQYYITNKASIENKELFDMWMKLWDYKRVAEHYQVPSHYITQCLRENNQYVNFEKACMKCGQVKPIKKFLKKFTSWEDSCFKCYDTHKKSYLKKPKYKEVEEIIVIRKPEEKPYWEWVWETVVACGPMKWINFLPNTIWHPYF